MIPSLEQLCANIESQALSKNFENDLNKLGEKFFTLLSLTSKDPDFYKFINSFNERDKFFFRKMLRFDKLGDQQVLHVFISKEQLNTEISELRNKHSRPQDGLRV
jgi:negative regulator of genetic competence, sporulation and motility